MPLKCEIEVILWGSDALSWSIYYPVGRSREFTDKLSIFWVHFRSLTTTAANVMTAYYFVVVRMGGIGQTEMVAGLSCQAITFIEKFI